MSTLLQTAINAALAQDWPSAISVNQKLLSENKNDISTLNRLAHAYAQTGKLDEAKKIYKKILSLDKYNIIALKNLDKLNSLPKSGKAVKAAQSVPNYSLSPVQFLEEPGKTKTVSLINTAPASVLSHLNPGSPVVLLPKKHSVDVRTIGKTYLGVLPDDFSFKLLRFLKAGYEYESFIKNASKNSISIFIREIKRAKRFKSQPSFLTPPASSGKNMTRDHKNLDAEDDEDEETRPQDDLDEV